MKEVFKYSWRRLPTLTKSQTTKKPRISLVFIIGGFEWCGVHDTENPPRIF